MEQQPSQWLSTVYYGCVTLDSLQGPQQLLAFIHDIGGELLYVTRDEVNPDPLALTTDESNLVQLYIEHPLLCKDDLSSANRTWGSADLYFGRRELQLALTQAVPDVYRPDELDALAHGQLALAQVLYPRLLPKYSCIDVDEGKLPDIKDVLATKIKSIFWANFFGSAYAEVLEREFLLRAPGWRVEVLADGSVLYVVSPSLVHRDKEIAKRSIESYFRQRIPQIRLFLPKTDPTETGSA